MVNQSICKTRFTPSPTGLMHLGNLRTALFSLLFANPYATDENKRGNFLIRIEDTDSTRSKDEFTQKLLVDLRWLGLDWQEGPEKDKGNGPYFQSKRGSVYEKYYNQLIKDKKAYYCFCTEKELQLSRRVQLQAGHPPRYVGTCRHLTKEQIIQKEAKGLKPTLRFCIPDDEIIQFEDLIQGPKQFQTNDIGDFIIQKNDGSASFMFCNAIDDSLMGITHVVRGEDHLTNTPRQLIILKALGLRAPCYSHMALIFGFDGKPLSKRNGSQSVVELREQGFFPLSILNYLSRLGHHFEKEALFSIKDLSANFSLKHVSRSPARYDEKQLIHWQKEALALTAKKELWTWMENKVKDIVPKDKSQEFIEAISGNIVTLKDAIFWANLFFGEKLEFVDEAKECLLNAGKAYINEAIKAIEHQQLEKKTVFNQIKTNLDIKGKALFMPMRVALTGVTFGPEMEKVFTLLGKEQVLLRLNQVLDII